MTHDPPASDRKHEHRTGDRVKPPEARFPSQERHVLLARWVRAAFLYESNGVSRRPSSGRNRQGSDESGPMLSSDEADGPERPLNPWLGPRDPQMEDGIRLVKRPEDPHIGVNDLVQTPDRKNEIDRCRTACRNGDALFGSRLKARELSGY